MEHNAYIKTNLILAGVIIVILIYSGIFSDKHPHPIKSAYNTEVISTGLSRAFSEIVRFNFHKAKAYNAYAIPLFIFFFAQLILRAVVSFLLFRKRFSKKSILFTDVLVSVLLFLYGYGTFIVDQLKI